MFVRMINKLPEIQSASAGRRRQMKELLLCILATSTLITGTAMGALEVNDYGEMVNTHTTLTNGNNATTTTNEMSETNSNAITETNDVDSSQEELGLNTATDEIADVDSNNGQEEHIANAVVYVFNNDDDKLSISLFIDSELKETKDISKEKEDKFGTYPLSFGPHKFEITWWDDDTKKKYEESVIETISEDKAVTIYTTKNTEPEEFDVTVTVVNQNDKDLDTYLYIDGVYEKDKEVKKENSADFGKIDVEEGVHEFSVRWRDPDTKIEYEKRKTVRVDGDEVIVFYAPKGIAFENEPAPVKTNSVSTTTSSSSTKAITNSDPVSKSPSDPTSKSSTTIDEIDKDQSSSTSSKVESTETIDSNKEQLEDESEEETKSASGPMASDIDNSMYLLITGLILAIYLIFFRR